MNIQIYACMNISDFVRIMIGATEMLEADLN